MEELIRVESERHAYPNSTKVQIFVNGLFLSYNVNSSATSYLLEQSYYNSVASKISSALINLTKVAIYKLTEAVTVIMGQVFNL
ncbi:6264_t:CDS:2 [Diversispora eburnea]|uniref:6264_t:CDS:1 n=1 Tax=Diversispora eburnea TaxID=1213867 RepID=A0A9N9AR51_9GLOM|nr:6264_t:CDS:2 [Diversispora eburnea]